MKEAQTFEFHIQYIFNLWIYFMYYHCKILLYRSSNYMLLYQQTRITFTFAISKVTYTKLYDMI